GKSSAVFHVACRPGDGELDLGMDPATRYRALTQDRIILGPGESAFGDTVRVGRDVEGVVLIGHIVPDVGDHRDEVVAVSPRRSLTGSCDDGKAYRRQFAQKKSRSHADLLPFSLLH